MVNMPRLEDALQVLFTKERMAGSEQYFCSSWARRRGMTLRCQKKCDAEVLTKIESLPPILTIRMQRLQYDRGSGNQTKLTNGVQIPLALDFTDFSNLVGVVARVECRTRVWRCRSTCSWRSSTTTATTPPAGTTPATWSRAGAKGSDHV